MSRKGKKGKILSITDKCANRFQNWLNLRYSSCSCQEKAASYILVTRNEHLGLLFTMFVAFPAENYSFKLILAASSWQKS